MLLFKNKEYKNIIAEDTEFSGNITTKSSVKINGYFTGQIATKGEVKLSYSSEVSADIIAESCRVEGVFNGSVNLEKDIEISAGAKFKGFITARKIIYNKGAELIFEQTTLLAENNEKTPLRTDPKR